MSALAITNTLEARLGNTPLSLSLAVTLPPHLPFVISTIEYRHSTWKANNIDTVSITILLNFIISLNKCTHWNSLPYSVEEYYQFVTHYAEERWRHHSATAAIVTPPLATPAPVATSRQVNSRH